MNRRTRPLLPLLLVLPLLSALAGCRPTTAWSPDGKQLALDPYGYLYTFDLATKKFQQRTRGPQKALNPAWSPDGKKIAYFQAMMKNSEVSALALNQFDVTTGKHSRLVSKLPLAQAQNGSGEFKINVGNAEDLIRLVAVTSWSPDGTQLAYSSPQGDRPGIWVAAADGSNPRQLLPEGRHGFDPAWSPDGRQIALLSSPAIEPPVPAAEPGAPPRPPSPDLEVISADGTGHRVLWNAKERGPLAMLGPGPRWSSDGKSILMLVDGPKTADGGMPENCTLWSVPVDGREPTEVGIVPGPSPFVTLNPHGTALTFFLAPKTKDEVAPTLASAVAPFSEPKSLHLLDAKLTGLAEGTDVDRFPIPDISPDGQQIAVALIPKKGQASLLLTSAAGGPMERFNIPAPVGAVPTKPAVKKPAAKKPVAKKRPVRKSRR